MTARTLFHDSETPAPGSTGRVASIVSLFSIGVITLLIGCSDGSSGSGGELLWTHLGADGVPALRRDDLFWNGSIRITFTRAVDPRSVTEETFAVMTGPDLNVPVDGTRLLVDKDTTLLFVPDVPTKPDLSDGAFRPGQPYRMVLAGRDESGAGAPAIRSKKGRALTTGATIDFGIRDFEPYFFDPAPEPPAVLGFLIDLDGDGEVGVDAFDPTQSIEFFEVPPDIDSEIAVGVRAGSKSLPMPDGPLVVGIVYDRTMHPTTLLHGFEREALAAALTERDQLYACDEPMPGDLCRRPLPATASLRHHVVANGTMRSVLSLRARVSLAEFAAHVIEAHPQATDLVGRPVDRACFGSFLTDAAIPNGSDAIIERFDERYDRDLETTAMWSADSTHILTGSPGWGGDGSDGVLEIAGLVTLDTDTNRGEWNFSSIESDAGGEIRIIGDKPAILRVRDDLLASTIDGFRIDADGGRGDVGQAGGHGGPGGGDGGSTETGDGAPADGGDGHPAFGLSAGAGGAGGAAAEAGGGGGAGHQTSGRIGIPGFGRANGGRGGEFYGVSGDRLAGAGGGAGGAYDDGISFDPGGSGGGGGGSVFLDVRGRFNLGSQNEVRVNGGRGGEGTRGSTPSGGGGGGSGGSILIRCEESTFSGPLLALAGVGGSSTAPAGRGGSGSTGYSQVEVADYRGEICFACSPPATIRQMSDDVRGHAKGRSRFYPTNLESGEAVYSFDGSDPLTGALRFDENVTDIRIVDENGGLLTAPVEGITMSIVFSGADEDPRRPHEPDPVTITQWTTDITELSGYSLIRFEVRIRSSEEVLAQRDFPYPGVDDVMIHFARAE